MQKIKNQNQNGKINGKELISSIREFNQIYMYDYLKNGNDSQTSVNFQNTGNIPLNYLEVLFKRKILFFFPNSFLELIEKNFAGTAY